ncbi:FHA domain-containing protein [Candidatus Venteria ishoeyi]|uniref:FHA domain-containing protein n=1 Tax=Candidatus Venteria ishoeyi TaxID=1899563 RepID=A0A1H6FI20_9GAMM|nr:FHA domain-containing protein [Candidatus Venteria ishoeyi]SEH08664.1 Uncharacterised protein [Candidatus Venteria ishoeyi]
MPLFRGQNGEVSQDDDDKTTRKLDRSPPSVPANDDMDFNLEEDPDTDLIHGSEPLPPINTTPVNGITPDISEDPKTRVIWDDNKKTSLWKNNKNTPDTPTEKIEPTPAPVQTAKDTMSDPVVGWVVVIDGPGKGSAMRLGYGMNSIGRANSERVCINFGDENISRTAHAVITYDPRGRKFYIQSGGNAMNLTYLAEQPVLTPTELNGLEEIVLGETKLRFVPFCGENFDWQDIN